MKGIGSLEAAKDAIHGLLGKRVNVKLNKGRNRVKNYSGVVQEMHSNVFVIKLSDEALFNCISCSYTDMLCGEVAISEAP